MIESLNSNRRLSSSPLHGSSGTFVDPSSVTLLHLRTGKGMGEGSGSGEKLVSHVAFLLESATIGLRRCVIS